MMAVRHGMLERYVWLLASIAATAGVVGALQQWLGFGHGSHAGIAVGCLLVPGRRSTWFIRARVGNRCLH